LYNSGYTIVACKSEILSGTKFITWVFIAGALSFDGRNDVFSVK